MRPHHPVRLGRNDSDAIRPPRLTPRVAPVTTPTIRSPFTRAWHLPSTFPGRPTGSRWDGRLQMRSKQEKCSTIAAEHGAPGRASLPGSAPPCSGARAAVDLPAGRHTQPPQPAARVSATADLAHRQAIRPRRLRSVLHQPLAGNEHRYHLARGCCRPRNRTGKALRPACARARTLDRRAVMAASRPTYAVGRGTEMHVDHLANKALLRRTWGACSGRALSSWESGLNSALWPGCAPDRHSLGPGLWRSSYKDELS
jgi:hypothetical protein